MALRQSREAVDLFAAIPEVGVINPARYDEALRSRLNPIRDIGRQQTSFVMEQSALKDAQRRQALMDRLRNSQASQYAGSGAIGGVLPVVNGKWYNPLGTNMKPTFGYGAAYSNPALAKGAGSSTHRGYDWSIKAGTPIYAPNAGTLLSYGFGNTGFGNELRLQFGNDLYGILGHLSKFAPGLKAGMQITPGMLLGYSGGSGNTSGDHLHMELRRILNRPDTAIDYGGYYGW